MTLYANKARISLCTDHIPTDHTDIVTGWEYLTEQWEVIVELMDCVRNVACTRYVD